MGNRWLITLVVLAALVGGLYIADHAYRRYDIRDRPLAHPIPVSAVSEDGEIHLVDGHAFRPAAIVFPTDPKAREAALQFTRLAVKQGVELRTDLGDGSAFLTCEPRFYNWCGTGRIGGWYIPCGLSELLIASGHATIDANAKLAEIDAERVRVSGAIADDNGTRTNPTHFAETGISFSGIYRQVDLLDQFIMNDVYPKKP